MVKRSKRSSHRRTKRRSVRSTRSRRHHRARHTRGRGKRMCGGVFDEHLKNWAWANHTMPPQTNYMTVQKETQAERDAYIRQLEEDRARGS